MGLSRRAYARHRAEAGLPGQSEAAVRKAIASGRITTLPDGTIDPARADKAWAAGTDGAKQRSETAMSAGVAAARETRERDERRPVASSAVQAVEEGASSGDAFEGGGHQVTYAKARAAKEAYAAQAAKLRLGQMRGDLVDKKRAVAHVYDLARKERDSWLQLPARVSANMAADLGVDAHAVEQVLDAVIRDHLARLAEIKVAIEADPEA